MTARPPHNPKLARKGFTLLEMMLVLAILVSVSAIVLPAFFGALSGQQLRKSADAVRSEWARARVVAMKTGRPQIFQYQLDGNRYQAQPLISEDDYLEADLLSLSSGQIGSEASLGGSGSIRQKQLAEGVMFAGAEAMQEIRSLEFQNSDTLASADMAEGEWSAPIFFYPDGTTSTARVFLANEKGRIVSIELRGLTGIATISDLLTEEELY